VWAYVDNFCIVPMRGGVAGGGRCGTEIVVLNWDCCTGVSIASVTDCNEVEAECISNCVGICEANHVRLCNCALIDLESEDNVSRDCDSEVTPCSLVIDKVDESEDVQPNLIFSEEQEQEAHASPESDFHVAPCCLNDDKVSEIEGPPACNGHVRPEKESDCSTEFDSHTAPCSSNSPVLNRCGRSPLLLARC